MAITGYLAEFSLAEIFQFLEQGHKTGLLTIVAGPDQRPPLTQAHYIWFRQGLIVAAANETDGQGLCRLINRWGWLGDRAAFRLAQSCPADKPVGLYLKSQGILDAEQLKLLFYTQVMRQVCALFVIEDGSFHFDGHAPIPGTELTGLSAPATEVTLAGLRALRDWSALADKLPEPGSTLISVIQGKPHLRLKSTEWQIWEFTDGHTQISEIAMRLNLSVEHVRKIAFRLIVVGLIEELPTLGHVGHEPESLPVLPEMAIAAAKPTSAQKATEPEVTHSFLQNLMGFLTGKS